MRPENNNPASYDVTSIRSNECPEAEGARKTATYFVPAFDARIDEASGIRLIHRECFLDTFSARMIVYSKRVSRRLMQNNGDRKS